MLFAFRYQDCEMTPLKAALDWPYRRRSQSARETFNSLSGFISKGPDEGEHKLIDHCFPGKGHAFKMNDAKRGLCMHVCVCEQRWLGDCNVSRERRGSEDFEWN